MRLRKTVLAVLLAMMQVLAFAQSVPTPKEVLGYEPGDRFSRHHQVVEYMQALAKAAPRQVKVMPYGTSNEGRPLMLVFISSEENIANLENIRQNNLRLAGLAEGSPNVQAPAIVWLSYNVHGNEASSSEACMVTAHYLLTQPNAKEWLRESVVVIDPCLNPDGRDRYINWYNGMLGRYPNVNPISREHMEPWPGGRSNHYNFDLNRDWAWQTQVETQQRSKMYNQWMPQVHVDYHEQGYNEPYYFAPAAEPLHEVITPWQRSFQDVIGRNHASYFDRNGWLYFTKERFDLFYPSYGDTWPTYNGAIGMTYEQGGIRAGLAIRNEDGDTLTLNDRIQHHHTTGISTVQISAKNAAALISNFKQFFDNTRQQGVGEFKSFVVKGKDNPAKVERLRQMLERNGIAYGYAGGGNARGYNYFTQKDEGFTLENTDLVIHTQQPRGVLAKVLFEPTSKLSDSATYDITAWSLPYVFGLQTYAVKEKMSSNPARAVAPLATIPPSGAYGYVLPWNSMASARVLAALIKAGVQVRYSEKPFTMGGKEFTPGSLIVLKTSNHKVANLDALVQRLAFAEGLTPVTLTGGYADKGVDFGSPDVMSLGKPRIALITGDGTSSLGAGELWHYLDRELDYPSTLINLNDAGRVTWSEFDVVILPDGYRYQNLLAKDGALAQWVQGGGRLVLFENAVAQAANAEWGIKARETEVSKGEKGGKNEYAAVKKYGDRERNSLLENNPGSILRVHLDNTHPLAFGYPEEYYTLKSDGNVYQFLENGWNVGIIKKNPVISGFTGSVLKQQLQDGLVFGVMPMGRGQVVILADDIIFRQFWENGKLMLANALFMVR